MDFASQGIIYAAGNGADIINCSWGSSSYLSFAVSAAVDAGVLIITSAGNDDNQVPAYFGTHPDVYSVAATTQSDTKATFSSYGTWVEISAPGVAIYTTAMTPDPLTHTYNSVQGTSFSSPITCGAVVISLFWRLRSRTSLMECGPRPGALSR